MGINLQASVMIGLTFDYTVNVVKDMYNIYFGSWQCLREIKLFVAFVFWCTLLQ